ncbi:major facilitator superfamily domain-containing protein [Dipodascopsis uninucleata]
MSSDDGLVTKVVSPDALAMNMISYGESEGTVEYRMYKRRWFGLIMLMILNIVASWNWLRYAPVASNVQNYFHLSSETPVNWLSVVVLFTYPIGSAVGAYILNRKGTKTAMLISSILLILGSWLSVISVKIYGGRGSIGLAMFSQIIIGLAQPLVLNAPSYYTDQWFNSNSRVTANALASLSNPLGGAIGQLVSPAIITEDSKVADMILYVAIISTILSIPSIAVPSKPPTPPCPSASYKKMSFRKSINKLVVNRRFVLIFIVFSVLVGFFNAYSSLIYQVMKPYGYTSDEAGYVGACLILAGLVFSAIVSPLIDKYHSYIIVFKAVPIISICYICLIFTQTESLNLAGPFIVSAVIGATSFSLLPVVLEGIQEMVYPISPELTSSLLWAGGNILGGIFIVVMDALKRPSDAGNPPGNMTRSLIFEAVVSSVVAPLPYFLGSKEQTKNRRVELDIE